MVKIDLKRIKNLKYQGTFLLQKGSLGVDLPEDIDMLGKVVSMYLDFELDPTTHFIIEDGKCKMYLRHFSSNNSFSDWQKFTPIK